MTFDPFESRQCRDVRNRIGHAFILSLQSRDETLFLNQISNLQSQPLKKECRRYIDSRKTHFRKMMQTRKPEDRHTFYEIAALLWNRGLFFEVHEWLEEKWLKTRGNEKGSLQALIMASTVFELAAYQRKAPAGKLAVKTIARIDAVRNHFKKPFNPYLLTQALSGTNLRAPVF